MLVSITAVGPVGSTAGGACVPGESGRSCVAPAGAVPADGAGACCIGASVGAVGGAVCCAEANALEKSRARANRRANGMRRSNPSDYRKRFKLRHLGCAEISCWGGIQCPQVFELSICRISHRGGFHGIYQAQNYVLRHTLPHAVPLGPPPALCVGDACHALACAAVPSRPGRSVSSAETSHRLGRKGSRALETSKNPRREQI